MVIRAATADDIDAIRATLAANAGDSSLFQQSTRRIRKDLGDFVVALDGADIVGCAALHEHAPGNVEILAVAVAPTAQGRGIGSALMRACRDRAGSAALVWLATAKPDYFARFGFVAISRWRLPVRTLARKLRLIFEQPPRRWLPALFGRHTFMRVT
jgi:amino-acid N-acetyltransferase